MRLHGDSDQSCAKESGILVWGKSFSIWLPQIAHGFLSKHLYRILYSCM